MPFFLVVLGVEIVTLGGVTANRKHGRIEQYQALRESTSFEKRKEESESELRLQ